MKSNFPEYFTSECHTDTVGDAIMQDHEYGYMQLESNHALNCKLGKSVMFLHCSSRESWADEKKQKQQLRYK